MQWFIILSLLIASLYATIMICFFIGWNKLKPTQNLKHTSNIRLSVLIALRNEESNIPNLIQSLIEQDFSQGDLEILLVDDHSTDNTLEILRNTTKKLSQFRILSLPEGRSGKKAALRFGQAHSNGEILVLTDADCQPGPTWLTSMINTFSEEKTGMVLGPVIMAPANTRFQKLMQLEYMSMVVSGAGSTGYSTTASPTG
jgi:biofilm PGA synthesis N-glycosyltransferase PgaC